MTRQSEDSKAGRAASKISDGLFGKGVLVGNSHADAARDAETGSRVRQAQHEETKGRWTNRVSIRTRAAEARRGRS